MLLAMLGPHLQVMTVLLMKTQNGIFEEVKRTYVVTVSILSTVILMRKTTNLIKSIGLLIMLNLFQGMVINIMVSLDHKNLGYMILMIVLIMENGHPKQMNAVEIATQVNWLGNI